MKYLIKKHRIILAILILPYLFLIVVGTYRTNKEITLTGDISPVGNLIEINSTYKQEGSFNSIFVMNFSNSTLLQNFLVNSSTVNEIEDTYAGYAHLSSSELTKMGHIQHDYAVECAILVAYNEAKKSDESIKIDYELSGAIVAYYASDTKDYQIGDIIYKVNDIDTTNQNAFIDAFNSRKAGDVLTVKRNGKDTMVTLTEDNIKKISIYSKYSIDYANAKPKIKVNSSVNQGSSAGLLQTLNTYNMLTTKDISLGKTIAGTGTISPNGSVGIIGGIKQKIHTAYRNKVDIFFCPEGNYEEALEAYNTLKNKERMTLVCVSTFAEALEYLQQ